MAMPVKGLYRFDEFKLDPAKRSLLRNNLPVSVTPKAFEILSYLVANPGRVVTKEELLAAVWPDSFVEESNLAQHISWLRKAFADRAGYIATIPGRGFQFTATVQVETAGGDAPAKPEQKPLAPAGRAEPVAEPSRGWRFMAVCGAVALGLLVAGYFSYRKMAYAWARPPVSIVVLPFANQTGDPAKDYLSDGVTEEVLNGLARVNGGKLRVIARTSSMAFKSSPKTVKEITQELGVQYALEGSLKSEGSRLHVTAQLIRGEDQSYLWADSFDGDSDQILEFENRLTDSVARELSLTLLAGKTPEHTPISHAAHEAYLQGLYFLAQRSKTGLESALERFGTAVAQDPQYARAYAELAVTYNLLGQFGWMTSEQAHSQARAAAQQAVAADPNLAEAHAALGFNDWFFEWNSRKAEKELLQAIQLEPTNVDARHWYALVLMTSKRTSEAEEQMRTALSLDPKALILRTNLGWIHYTNREYPQAIQEMQAVVGENPDFLTAHYKLWWAYSMAGDIPRAMQEVNAVARLVFDAEGQNKIAAAYEKEGYPAALKAMMISTDANPPYLVVDDARRMSFAGDQAATLQLLQRALKNREGWMVVVESDPAFDSLRADPGFVALMRELHAASAAAD
ncbi:MAG TPA: winged helix-turn-helix domain-containing protein [Candidatus Acidoferrales bacterium]